MSNETVNPNEYVPPPLRGPIKSRSGGVFYTTADGRYTVPFPRTVNYAAMGTEADDAVPTCGICGSADPNVRLYGCWGTGGRNTPFHRVEPASEAARLRLALEEERDWARGHGYRTLIAADVADRLDRRLSSHPSETKEDG